ncbi:MAG: rhamnulokinase [Verrucomicrobiales bacterium]|jgi:rhamnulokinase|nr:rhamnulokinase [Verrucomicrobiales bacterium]
MTTTKVCLAVDLGAGSGRVLAGVYDGATLTLKELNRFPSEQVKDASGWHWDFDALFRHIKEGIKIAVSEYGEQVVSLGVDNWGVDYGLLDANGRLLAQPFQYRDNRTDGMMELAYSRMPQEEIYRRTGIQFMFFNTLYQLLAERDLAKADQLLFMPCLVNYLLTGRKVNECSIASTGQLLDAKSQMWDLELIEKMGFPEKLFSKLEKAGTNLGPLLASVQQEVGETGLQVILPGCHDTASAVAGIPAVEREPVFLSSGTWSLIGRELPEPILTGESFRAGFSNESGVRDTVRFLKNIAGMWLLQESKRVWDANGEKLSYDEIVRLAAAEPAFGSLVDPDAADFQAPVDMTEAIANYCRRTNQTVPLTVGQIARCIFESLALKYRTVIEKLETLTGKPVGILHIVGGGSQNAMLNQFAADATNCRVIAGPVEATSLGNILMQLLSLGEISSLAEGRALVRNSFATTDYLPQNTAAWDEAAARFHYLTGR